jgi:hypothetical protein
LSGGAIVGLLILFAPVALGDYQPGGDPYGGSTNPTDTRYNPPPPTSGPTGSRRGGTGTRGICADKEITLTALAPLSHTGRTISTHPTFAWFVSEATSQPIEVSLYEYVTGSKVKRIYKTQLQPSQGSTLQGMMQFTLPETEPELIVGRRYLWQAALLCNLNHSSNDLVAEATIDVVAAPPNLKTALAATKNSLQKAQLYAASSFWYDALAETLDNPQAKAFRLSLLRDLEQLETPKDAKATTEQSHQLKQVIAVEERSSYSVEQRPNSIRQRGAGTR